jgi:hypothetical protein
MLSLALGKRENEICEKRLYVVYRYLQRTAKRSTEAVQQRMRMRMDLAYSEAEATSDEREQRDTFEVKSTRKLGVKSVRSSFDMSRAGAPVDFQANTHSDVTGSLFLPQC